MSSQYEKLIKKNLEKAFQRPRPELAAAIPASDSAAGLCFKAFGENCCLRPDRITLADHPETGPRGLIISLYARHVGAGPIQVRPLQAYQDFPDSRPYHGAFRANSEITLVPHVKKIHKNEEWIIRTMDGQKDAEFQTGDFSFIVFPLPKIALGYIFYLPDDEFPASVTCLLSANASSFMPLDGLADVAEYCSQKIIQSIKEI